MRWTANVVAKLKTSVPLKTIAALTTANNGTAQQRILQPDDEDIVHQIKAIGIGGQIAEKPRMPGREPQADGDEEKATGGASQHKTQIGGDRDAERCAAVIVSAVNPIQRNNEASAAASA